MFIQREHFIFVGEETAYVLYALLLIAIVLFVINFYRRSRLYGGLRPIKVKNILQKIKFILESERRFLSERYGGIMHTCMVLGLIILFIGTCIVFIEYDLLLHFFNMRILTGPSYLIYEFILDVGGLLFLIGIMAALIRRIFIKPERLVNSAEAFVVLIVLLYICLSGFILEGLRLAIAPIPWGVASFIGLGFSILFQPLNLTAEIGKTIYIAFWWSHFFAAIFAGLIVLTRTKLRHSILYFLGEIRPLEKWLTSFKLAEVLESKSLPTKVGVKQAQEFSWSQKINLDACTQCGRCQDVCPAFRAGKILSPKEIIRKMQNCLVDIGHFNPKDIVSNYVSEEEVWLCVTDGACVKACPVFINPLEYLIELKRHQTMNLGKPPTRALFNILLRENPYGLPRSERVSWMRDLKVKTLGENEEVNILYWVGCACSYDAHAQKIARAMVKILKASGVDFAVLKDEGCCGELARRLGDECLFQEIALKNVQKLSKRRFNMLLVTCPHCYNAFKNDYRDFELKVKVVSHVEFISRLLEANRLKLGGGMARTVTYHDPCYLRLYNNITAPARKVLHSIRECKLVEMKNFFCCGGGGGGSWMELPAELRPSLRRFEDAEAVNPDVIATSCPYCTSMLEDAVKVKGAEGKITVKDLTEIVAEFMG